MLTSLLLAAAITIPQPSTINSLKVELGRRGVSAAEIASFFADPRLKVYPVQVIKSKPVNWTQYRRQILQTQSVNLGAKFISAYQSAFDQAEQQYGVPKEMVAAILRIETGFGSYTGNYVVPNVFYSFMVHGSKVEWASQNLIDYLVYANQQGIDPFSIKGSYAGAFGLGQFLPSSVVSYGVDGDGDHKIDLFNPDDMIPSIANFLAGHGFARSQRAALTGYYGSSNGYPLAAIQYAAALKKALARG